MLIRNLAGGVMTVLALLFTGGVGYAGNQGQVITAETREWARKVVLEEKSLGAPTGTNTLMVLYYQNKTGDVAMDPLQKGLTLMLITDLSQVGGLQIVERVKLQALTEELRLGVSGIVDPATAPRAGKLVGARWVVGGDLAAPQPERLAIASRLVDVPTTNLIGQPTAEGALAEFFQIEKNLVYEIVKNLKISLTPEAQEALRKPFSTSFTAVIDLSLGVDASDRGDYFTAADYYSEALQEDPTIPIAAAALKELRDRGLLDGWKRSTVIGKTAKKTGATGTAAAGTAGTPESTTVSSAEGAESGLQGSTKTGDLLTTVSNSTSQTRTLKSPPVNDQLPSLATKTIIDIGTPVTGAVIFPSPNVTASSALTAANGMLKSVARGTLRR